MTDDWMNDDVTTGMVESEEEEEKLSKESKSDLVNNQQAPAEEEKAKMPVGGFSLPISEMTEDWMDDEVAIISDDDDSEEDEKAAVQEKIAEMEKKLSKSDEPKTNGISLPTSEVTDAWMDDDIVALESEDENEEDYDEDDLETQMLLDKKVPKESSKSAKEGRLSALAEAQKFSCDEEDEEPQEVRIVDEVKVSQDEESTSWAFVAAKESQRKEETVSKTKTEANEHAPALVVEIIEKEKKVETIDKEGYKVVKGKNKVKKTSAEVRETENLIKELDQPLEPISTESKPVETKKSAGINLPVVEMTDDWMDDTAVMGSMDSDEEEEKVPKLPKISLPEKHSQSSQQDPPKVSEPDNEETNDPWLAVKPEYKRKDSTSSEKESEAREDQEQGYTIQVKVTTKETCLGRKLHEKETNDQDWKMDVTCTQKGQIPNIVEGHEEPVVEKKEKRRSKSGFDQIEEERKYHSLPRLKTSSECSQGSVPPLSPSWMRKDFSRSTTSIDSNQSIESGLNKERKTSDSRASIVTSSCETLDDQDDDVYWRLKQKVKKKKRKNRPGQDLEKGSETKAAGITEPIIEETGNISQTILTVVSGSVSRVEVTNTEKVAEMNLTAEDVHPHARQSMEGTTRKISTSRSDVPCERTLSLENGEIFSQEAASVRQTGQTSNIATALEEVAQTDVTNDLQKKISITPSITLDQHTSSASSAQVEIKMDPPDIVLSESRMEQATELLRACSPRDNTDEKETVSKRPAFKRQNSKEMQSAVEMPRGGPSPVSFEKQRHLSVSGPPEPWQDEGDDNGTNYSEEDKEVSSLAAITSKVSAPKKSGKRP